MNRTQRIEKIKENIPARFFFEKIYEDCAFASIILANVNLDYSKSDQSNILNCSPLLRKEQETHLFRKLNYLKYRLVKNTIGFEKSNEELAPQPRKPTNLDRIQEKKISELESLISRIQEVRNLILKANTRLIVKPVSKHFSNDGFERDEFISNAYIHIIKIIDAFDHRRGVKFSTYCINALKKNLYKDRMKLHKDNSYLDNSEIDSLAKEIDLISELNSDYNKSMVEKILRHLKKNKKQRYASILKMSFGIDCDVLKQKDIASKIGLSRQRVQQLKNDAYEIVRHLQYDPLV